MARLRTVAAQFPVVVVTGARQTGKTTLLREAFPDHNYVSLDLPSLAEQAEYDPDQFLADHAQPLVIDEVQHAPKLFRHLKRVVDKQRHRMGQFALTGSQKFTLMREVSDSLAGRVVWLELEPLSLAEIRTQVPTLDDDLPAVLVRGLYPELWRLPSISSRDFYASYLATYLERDVRQILNVSSLRAFERFIRIVAARSGQLLNKSEIAKDVGVSIRAITDWLHVLEASNLVVLLEPCFQNIAKRGVKSPKVYLGDPGLLCFLLNLTAETLPGSPYRDAVWETLLYAEMRKAIAAHGLQCDVYYYRDQRAREIDFVFDSGGALTFVDAMWTEHPDVSDVRAIIALDTELRQSALRMKPGHHSVICRTRHRYPITDNVTALPYTDLLTLLDAPNGE